MESESTIDVWRREVRQFTSDFQSRLGDLRVRTELTSESEGSSIVAAAKPGREDEAGADAGRSPSLPDPPFESEDETDRLRQLRLSLAKKIATSGGGSSDIGRGEVQQQ